MWRRPTALRSTTVDDGVLLLVRLGPGTVVVDFEPEVNPTTLSLDGWRAYMADVLARLNAAGIDLVLVTDPASLTRAKRILGPDSMRMMPSSSARSTARQLTALETKPITAIWASCTIHTAALARRLDVPIVFMDQPREKRRPFGRLATRLLLVKESRRPAV